MISTSAVMGPVPPWVGIAAAGGGLGFGLWLVLLALLPTRPRLSAVLAATRADPVPPPGHDIGDPGLDGIPAAGLVRATIPAARMLRRAGLPSARIVADLRVTGRPEQVHLAVTVTAAVAGLMAPALLSVPLALLDAGWLPWWTWLACGAVGFLVPDLGVRAEAARRRVELRRAVGTVLDLSSIALAGGAGVEQALHGAAAVGAGWAHERIRAVLDGATTTRTDPWAALGRLGTDLGVDELAELAATLQLAGTEGARVRASLTAKAAALRANHQTGDEAAAASATERMSLPVILLFAAYLVFIGYPALSQVLTQL